MGTNVAGPSALTYAEGLSDVAVVLFGTNGVNIAASPELNVGLGDGVTFEGWINPSVVDERNQVIFEWNDSHGNVGLHLSISQRQPFGGGAGSLWANLYEVNNTAHWFPTAGGLIAPNTWSHFALTYDRNSGASVIYCNGFPVAQTNFGALMLQTSYELLLGRRLVGANSQYNFAGKMDEFSLYRRALAAAEIQTIFSAGGIGKCKTNASSLPSILAQPVSQSKFIGETAAFSVVVVGHPLTYQWNFNGVALVGSTNANITLTNLQSANAGDYSVVVSNLAGSVVSSNATLTVRQVPACLPAFDGLIAWWAFDGDGADLVGSNPAITPPGSVFTMGYIGEALVVNGSSLGARAAASPSLNVGTGPGLTMEGWIRPSVVDERNQTVFEWSDGRGNVGLHLSLSQRQPYGGGPGSMWANLIDDTGRAHWFPTVGGLFQPNVWSHFALTYDKASGVAVLYFNGNVIASQNFGSLNLDTSLDLMFGRRLVGATTEYPFVGSIDDMSLYARALSSTEIQVVFAVGSNGKCLNESAPIVTIPPRDKTVMYGGDARFLIGAIGTRPLFYQWLHDGIPIPDGTNAAIDFTNVEFAQAGKYSVIVSNSLGTVVSVEATLTVLPPDTSLRIVGTPANPGDSAVFSVELFANGRENAIGFSLAYDPALITVDDVFLSGNVASAASLLVNRNEASAGRIGIAIGLPADEKFSLGTQTLVSIQFRAAVVSAPVIATIEFGDVPTMRQVASTTAGSMPASYVGGTIAIARAELEADVSPRPSGDFAISVVDWVQLGRFAARLDSVANSNEFQRADCAPRVSRGNGLISVSDWVQAGRYAVGLDPLTVVGGPLMEDAGEDGGGLAAASTHDRRFRLKNTTIAQGRVDSILVTLDCLGNENAASFSVSFDPAKLGFVGATLGSAVVEGIINLNTNEITHGRVGVAIANKPGVSLRAGSSEIARLWFLPLIPATATTVLGFGSDPVPREVSDVGATPLPTDYITGTITISPPPGPPLKVTRSGGSLLITWSSSAVGFELEATQGGLGTLWTVVPGVVDLGEQKLAIVSIGQSERFFRLRKQ